MVLGLLRITINRWKYLVFCSPSLSHCILDFWHQKHSSCASISCNSSRNFCSRYCRYSDCFLPSAFWIPPSRARHLNFLSNRFSNTVLSHCCTLSRKSSISSAIPSFDVSTSPQPKVLRIGADIMPPTYGTTIAVSSLFYLDYEVRSGDDPIGVWGGAKYSLLETAPATNGYHSTDQVCPGYYAPLSSYLTT